VTPPVPHRCGHPPGSKNKKTLAAAAAATAASSSAAVATVGCPAAIATVASPSAPVLVDAPPAYTLVEGYRCFIVPVLPRVMGLLRLPSKFTEIMKGFDLSQAVLAAVLDRLWRAGGLLPPLFHTGVGRTSSTSASLMVPSFFASLLPGDDRRAAPLFPC
jgi:hypothetical protein